MLVTAGGAVALPTLARRTAAAGLTGFEWAVGVPGSIGGAVRMNAGGHGSDIASCLVDVADRRPGRGPTRTPTTRSVAQLGLRFRGSDLTAAQVVVAARLRLHPGDRHAAEAEIAEIVRWRREHQPGGQNAGSVFVNPVPGELSAGRLIDDLGLRGLRIGTAWVSEKHANFIQAGEGGRAADVRAVMEAVRRRVADERGFRLRSEVRLVGFPPTTAERASSSERAERAQVPDATVEPRCTSEQLRASVRRPTTTDACHVAAPDVPSAEVLDELLAGVLRRRQRPGPAGTGRPGQPEVDELLGGRPEAST